MADSPGGTGSIARVAWGVSSPWVLRETTCSDADYVLDSSRVKKIHFSISQDTMIQPPDQVIELLLGMWVLPAIFPTRTAVGEKYTFFI